MGVFCMPLYYCRAMPKDKYLLASWTLTAALISTVLFMLQSCGGTSGNSPTAASPPAVVQKGNRLIEIDINEAADNDFAAAFNRGQSVGMDSVSLSIDWNLIDIGSDQSTTPPTPIYQTDPGLNFLAIANSCYPNSGTMVSLTLRPIKTLAKITPPGFEGIPFDDPALIDRFKATLDFVFDQIPDLMLTSLIIGSEVDLYLSTDQSRQSEYLTFYQQVSDYARAAYSLKYPSRAALKVAVEVTRDGLLDMQTRNFYRQLNSSSDVIGVSYYPLQGGLVQDPDIVDSDFQALTDLYPGTVLFFYQLGYPSGYYSPAAYPELAAGTVTPLIKSSDNLQTQFIDRVFSA